MLIARNNERRTNEIKRRKLKKWITIIADYCMPAILRKTKVFSHATPIIHQKSITNAQTTTCKDTFTTMLSTNNNEQGTNGMKQRTITIWTTNIGIIILLSLIIIAAFYSNQSADDHRQLLVAHGGVGQCKNSYTVRVPKRQSEWSKTKVVIELSKDIKESQTRSITFSIGPHQRWKKKVDQVQFLRGAVMIIIQLPPSYELGTGTIEVNGDDHDIPQKILFKWFWHKDFVDVHIEVHANKQTKKRNPKSFELVGEGTGKLEEGDDDDGSVLFVENDETISQSLTLKVAKEVSDSRVIFNTILEECEISLDMIDIIVEDDELKLNAPTFNLNNHIFIPTGASKRKETVQEFLHEFNNEKSGTT